MGVEFKRIDIGKLSFNHAATIKNETKTWGFFFALSLIKHAS